MTKRVIRKYIEYAYTKLRVAFKQKVYKKNGVSLKYLFERSKRSKTVVVVFSSCVREGLKARYNYVRSLKPIETNKLFILDDFAEDQRGCYYLGTYPDYEIEKTTAFMIEDFCKKCGAEKLILCGSSKGGWAALNFGMQICFPNVVVISGAPQYYLGDYLKTFPLTFAFVKGNHDPNEVIDELNDHLKLKIGASSCRGELKVYLHYSVNEHTYQEHIHDLLEALKEQKTEVIEDCQSYEQHSEVSLWFPDFLVSSIKKELE